ncbi:MAG: hypothetical protein OXH92_01385 [Bryobacterales bacterium]|nr:hypothetical protein [Bryobacterales bacterium]MDE0295425.1 hypothetical protein [Bryobacterales bacterium]MDE0432637.1 hypothetical protein [Bryobacterales bacterium]
MRLLAVLNVLSSTPARAKRLAPRPDGPLTHFASPRGETCRLALAPKRGRSFPGELLIDASDHFGDFYLERARSGSSYRLACAL